MDEKPLLTRETLASEISALPGGQTMSQGQALACVNHVILRLTECMRDGRPVRFRGSFSMRVKNRHVPKCLGSHETKVMKVITVTLSDQ